MSGTAPAAPSTRASTPLHVLCVVAARPNFAKMAPVLAALHAAGHTAPLLHTGQHHDAAMSAAPMALLGMPAPAVNLGIHGGDHASQTGRSMQAFAPHLARLRPDVLLVAGDVNATLACALVAAKAGVPIAHVEAGLRSFDASMPEEVNRRLVDQLSAVLLTPSAEAVAQLRREGVAPARIAPVGNLMIDTLVRHLPHARAAAPALYAQHGLRRGGYVLASLHRPANVDAPAQLAGLLAALAALAEQLPVLLLQHPRLQARLAAQAVPPRLVLLPPQDYHAALALQDGAALLLTDSGGMQEEATYLATPCLTLRPNTERPATVTCGSNTVAGTDPPRILALARARLATPRPPRRCPPQWDGQAAPRVVAALEAAAAAGFASWAS